MKKLEFLKKLTENLNNLNKLEDVIDEEISELAYEELINSNEYFEYEDAYCYLKEKGITQLLSNYQYDTIYDYYLENYIDQSYVDWA